MSVKFQYGTQADYDSLENFDSTCIYFITDTQRVYRGDTLYASGIKDVIVNGESVKVEGIVDISVPTKTSELQNDSNFVSDANYIHTDNNFTSEEKDKLGTLVNYDDTAIKEQIAGKQDALTAGENITIDENNVISAANGSSADVPFASSSQAGIIRIPIGCGIRQVSNDGSVIVDFPIEEITCQDKSIDITKGTGSRNIEVNKNFMWGYVKDLAHKTEVGKKADKTYVDGELAKKQNNLTAGAGISINEDNVISTSAHFQVEVVTLNEQGLPNVNEPNSQVLYLTHNTQTEVSDVYNEWLWIYDTEYGSFVWKKIGSTQVDLSGYAQKSELPTKTSELQNDSNFVSDESYVHTDNNFTNEEKTKLENDVATKAYVEQEIATFDFIKIVEALPEQGLPNRTYFVLKTDQQTNDLYDEYMWVNNKWEFVGTRQIEVDLTNYAQKSELPTKTSELQNDSGYITADDAPPEVYIGSGEPQGNEVIWIDNSTTAENINATKAYVDSLFKHKYSTDEQVVGTWIDGKPVYERVLHYDTISQSGEFLIYYYDKDGNQITIPIERIISMDGFFVVNGAGANPRSYEPIPRVKQNWDWSFTADWFQEDKFQCRIGGNFNQFAGGISDVNIIIRYTKTTDAIPQDVTE